jgi:glycosyl transferase family 25
MLNNFVDNIFVVNLPHRTDRLKEFDRNAKRFGFKYEVFEAFNGKEKISENFEYDGIKVGSPYVNPNYFKGQVGCLISHLNLIKLCKERNYKRVMIFEDDCGFHDEFESRFTNLFNKIKDDWQMIYLSGSLPEFIENYDGYSRISKILTTHSYLVKSEVYDIIINNFLQNLFDNEVDVCYSKLHSSINAYVAMPFLTYQSAGYSDIGESYTDYHSIRKFL